MESKDQKTKSVKCRQCVVLKEYNLLLYYEIKHLSTYSKFSGSYALRNRNPWNYVEKTKEISLIKSLLKNLQNSAKDDEWENLFTNENFIKESMIEAENYLCAKKDD